MGVGGRWWPVVVVVVVVSTGKCQSSAYCLVSNDNCHSFRQPLPFTTGFTVTSIPRSSVGPAQAPWGSATSLALIWQFWPSLTFTSKSACKLIVVISVLLFKFLLDIHEFFFLQ